MVSQQCIKTDFLYVSIYLCLHWVCALKVKKCHHKCVDMHDVSVCRLNQQQIFLFFSISMYLNVFRRAGILIVEEIVVKVIKYVSVCPTSLLIIYLCRSIVHFHNIQRFKSMHAKPQNSICYVQNYVCT